MISPVTTYENKDTLFSFGARYVARTKSMTQGTTGITFLINFLQEFDPWLEVFLVSSETPFRLREIQN